MDIFRNGDAIPADLPGHHVLFVEPLTLDFWPAVLSENPTSSEMGRMDVES